MKSKTKTKTKRKPTGYTLSMTVSRWFPTEKAAMLWFNKFCSDPDFVGTVDQPSLVKRKKNAQ